MNIVSYATCIPGLITWLLVLARILYHKAKIWGLILICSLMILFSVAQTIMYQVEYNAILKKYEGDEDVQFFQ